MEELVQKQLNAYNARDLEIFCECYHPEVIVNNLISNQITCAGIEKFKASYKILFESSPKLNCELKNRTVTETAVIDEEWVTGSAKYPAGVHAVAIYGFRDNLIDRVWFVR